MTLPPSLTTVTLFSKILAGILFFTFIISGFFAGMKYQAMIDLTKYQQANLITANPSPTPIDKTANWKTYIDSSLNYSFQYPPTTCELQTSFNDNTFSICYLPKGSDGGLKQNNGYVISLVFISKTQLSEMGVTYCGSPQHINDSRCELFKMGKVSASIDWGKSIDGIASALISHPRGGLITFILQPVTDESKEILKQILSTIKFADQNQTVPTNAGGQSCGGIAGAICPTGYKCQLNGTYPDASGKCVKQ